MKHNELLEFYDFTSIRRNVKNFLLSCLEAHSFGTKVVFSHEGIDEFLIILAVKYALIYQSEIRLEGHFFLDALIKNSLRNIKSSSGCDLIINHAIAA